MRTRHLRPSSTSKMLSVVLGVSSTSTAFCGLQADYYDDNAEGRRDLFCQSRSTQRSTAHRMASARPGSTPSATSSVYLSLIVIHFWLISTIGLSDERIV